MHILWCFSSTPIKKGRKRPWNLYKYENAPQNVPQVSSEASLPRLIQNKPSALIRREENKVDFLERQFHSEKLSFVHKKETEHSFELSLSICVFYRRIFNLEMQNFSLENHHMMNARQPLCWWMTFTKVLNPFLPWPHKWLTWTLDVCGGVGYGWFYWFSLKIFFQTSPELETFQRDWNNDVVFFFQHYQSWAILFFSAGYFNFFQDFFDKMT